MWSAEDRAREAARRQGRGLTGAQVAQKVAEAAVREQETQRQLGEPQSDRGPFTADPEELAELWVAKHVEWRRIAALLETTGAPVYIPEGDVEGAVWAREREERRQTTLDRHAAWVRERQEAQEELRAQVWLPAAASRRLRAIADQAGLRPEQVLAQLADRVRMNADGTVTIEPYVPG
ncbi:hypothetical protein [Streptomyces noursei]|uniref:hypothetical protein n=1 Tax=Streptomyces noursei TaxID=1971 RepID=UPI00380D5331